MSSTDVGFDALDVLGVAPAAARIIRYFLVRPDARPHGRALQRTLDLASASLQREVGRMVELGALRKEREGRRIHFAAVDEAPLWKAMRILEAASTDPAPLIRDALADVPDIRAAFIFGSAATGGAREDSDIDILVLEEPGADPRTLLRRLAEVGMLLAREVSAVRYTPEDLARRLGDRTHPARGFVRGVLTGPKRWVAGAASELVPLAMAAGIAEDELMGRGE